MPQLIARRRFTFKYPAADRNKGSLFLVWKEVRFTQREKRGLSTLLKT
jgi:hypothetical protein